MLVPRISGGLNASSGEKFGPPCTDLRPASFYICNGQTNASAANLTRIRFEHRARVIIHAPHFTNIADSNASNAF